MKGLFWELADEGLMDQHLLKFSRVLLQRNAPVTIWFGINEYHFECKGDINRRNCTVLQRKPLKKIRFQDSNPSRTLGLTA